MDKIILRRKVVDASISRFHNASNCEKLKRGDVTHDFILKEVFEESLALGQLNDEYKSFARSGKSNFFAYCYSLSPQYGVVLDSHITIYRFDPEAVQLQKEFFDWVYAEESWYIADTWWFSDEEILSDILRMTMIEFLEKYSG